MRNEAQGLGPDSIASARVGSSAFEERRPRTRGAGGITAGAGAAGRALAVGLLAVGVLAVAGCGSSPSAPTEAATDVRTVVADAQTAELSTPIDEELGLEGVTLWVGSAANTEDDATRELLASVTIQALEAAGANAEDERSFGAGFLTREALLSGEIDLYWEGIGQVWTVLLRQPADDLSGAGIHERLFVRDLDDNGLVWLDLADVESGPRFAIGPDVAAASGIETLTDLARWLDRDDEAILCVTSAFVRFPIDGQVAVETALEVTLPEERLRIYDPEPIYPDTSDGPCTVGLVSATSGRVPLYDLELISDDVGAFLPNPPAPVVRESVLLEHPGLATLLNGLAARLDTRTLQEMNRAVLLDGQPVDEVAASWLATEELID